MIYLIGGAPRVGKSIIAKKIAEAEQAHFLSTDDICSKATKQLSPEEKKTKFPLPGFSGDPSENTLNPEERVKLQIISAKSLAPDIEKAIEAALSQKESLVIEGVHILPVQAREWIEKFGPDQFKVTFVGLENVEQIISGIMKNTSPDNWMRDSNPAVIRQVAEFVSAFSSNIRQEADKNHFPYDMRTEDFERDVRRIMECLMTKPENPMRLK